MRVCVCVEGKLDFFFFFLIMRNPFKARLFRVSPLSGKPWIMCKVLYSHAVADLRRGDLGVGAPGKRLENQRKKEKKVHSKRALSYLHTHQMETQIKKLS
jgi:hypothetical protein